MVFDICSLAYSTKDPVLPTKGIAAFRQHCGMDERELLVEHERSERSRV